MNVQNPHLILVLVILGHASVLKNNLNNTPSLMVKTKNIKSKIHTRPHRPINIKRIVY